MSSGSVACGITTVTMSAFPGSNRRPVVPEARHTNAVEVTAEEMYHDR